MDRPPQDHIDLLLNGFRTLLESYRPADPDETVNPADAFFIYRLLLGRNPNVASELPALLQEPGTFRELRQRVLDSDEFAKGGSLTPPHRLWMTALEGFRFWFNTSDRDMGVVMAMGQYEPESVRFIRKVLRPGMTCIDAGAQTGFYTCLMASVVGEGGMVHAFEPMPASYELLVKNVQENRFETRVRTYQLACSNAATEIEASQVGAMYVAGAVPGCPPVSMRAIPVDEIVQGPVDLHQDRCRRPRAGRHRGDAPSDSAVASRHRFGVQRVLAEELLRNEQRRLRRAAELLRLPRVRHQRSVGRRHAGLPRASTTANLRRRRSSA